MITEWLVKVGAGFVDWIVSLFPTLALPDGLVHLDDSVNGILAMGDGLGAFFDWTALGLLAAIPLTVWVAGLLLKGTRALLAHIPLIGGKG